MSGRVGAPLRALLGTRGLVCLAVVCVLGASLASTHSLTLDKSLASLMPDSSPELARSAALLDLAPFSKIMAVQLTATERDNAAFLPEAADNVLAGIDPELAETAFPGDSLPDMERVMAMLPALCGDDCRSRIAEAMREEGLPGRFAGLKEGLSGAGFALSGLFWRVDPLDLRGEVFRLFPRLTGFPRPDPVSGYPVSDDGLRLLLLLKPKIPMSDTEGCVRLMENLDHALAAGLPPGVSAQIAGGHRHTAANAGAITRDLVVTMSLAMLLILAIYIFLVRSWGALWLFLTPAAAVLVATALLAVIFPAVSGLALGFGAAVLGIAEDYAVHVHFALRRSPDRASAVRHTAKPLFMSVLLCAGGFGVLLWSAVPAVRQLSVFTILSIVAGYVWAMLVLPHCPGMDKPREVAGVPARACKPKKKTALATACALAVVTSCLYFFIPQNASVRNLGFMKPELVRDQNLIEEGWNLNRGIEVFLAEGDTNEQALALAARVEETVRKASPDAETASLSRLWPSTEEQRKHLRRWKIFMEDRRDAFAAMFAKAAGAEGFDPEAFAPFWRWFSASSAMVDADAFVKAGFGFLPGNFLAEKNGRSYAVVMVRAPAGADIALIGDFNGKVTNLSARKLERGLGEALARDRRLIPVAAVVCFAILIATYKNLYFAVLAFIPALAGLTGVLVWLMLSGRSLGLVEATGLPLVICLGADYGILAVNEFSESLDLGAARAILVAGLTTVAGIGILVLASHPVLKTLGGTVCVGLLAAMPAAIVLLPKLCLESQPKVGAPS